jgi:hypothetical protein
VRVDRLTSLVLVPVLALAAAACSSPSPKGMDASGAPSRSDAAVADAETTPPAADASIASDAAPDATGADDAAPVEDAATSKDAAQAEDAAPGDGAGADDAKTNEDAGAVEPMDGGGAPADSGALACTAPRHYQYAIPSGVALPCAGASTEILRVSIPDQGRALARAEMVYTNVNASAPYYWNTQALVGAPLVYYGLGDDVCPGASTVPKAILGYGAIGPGASDVVIIGHEGSSPCTDNQIVVSSGTLDVYVEDPAAACTGRDIQLISSYDVYGLMATYAWTTSMTQLLTLPVPASTARSSVLVLGVVEGTPDLNPNTLCGSESATLVSQVQSDDLGILATAQGVIPASGGLGHLVLDLEAQAPLGPTLTAVSLWVGSNTAATVVRTGGCCGDGKVGFVKLP